MHFQLTSVTTPVDVEARIGVLRFDRQHARVIQVHIASGSTFIIAEHNVAIVVDVDLVIGGGRQRDYSRHRQNLMYCAKHQHLF